MAEGCCVVLCPLVEGCVLLPCVPLWLPCVFAGAWVFADGCCVFCPEVEPLGAAAPEPWFAVPWPLVMPAPPWPPVAPPADTPSAETVC